MRTKVSEFIELTDAEKEALWETATFVFDANVLLNLYRYSKETRDALLEAIQSIGQNIWIPYQVAYEFMTRRCGVIYESQDRYRLLEKDARTFITQCTTNLRLNRTESIEELEKFIFGWIKNQKEQDTLVSSPLDDVILNKLLDLFDNKTGDPTTEDQLNQIKEEGRERYDKKIPPGYEDAKKRSEISDNNAFGDLILWKQICSYASNNNKDVIFVTHDQKEDWWNTVSGKTVGPRPELRSEFSKENNRLFHMYTMNGFIEQSSMVKGNAPNQRVIDEIADVEWSEENSDSINPLAEHHHKNDSYNFLYGAYLDSIFPEEINASKMRIYPTNEIEKAKWDEKLKLIRKIYRSREAVRRLEKKFKGEEMPQSVQKTIRNTNWNIHRLIERLNKLLYSDNSD